MITPAAKADVICVAYEGGKRIGDIALDAISDVLARNKAFVWVSLVEPDAAMLEKMQEEFGLHELAIEDANVAHQRPKIESYGDSIFIVLMTAQLQGEVVEYGELHLFVGANFLVSVWRGTPVDEERVRARCEEMSAMMPKGPAFVLYALLDHVTDHYAPLLDRFEKEFETLEQNVFKDELDRLVIGKIYRLKRQLLKLRNAALPVNEICTELMRLHEDLVPKELRAYFRDIQDHVTHLVGMADSMENMLTSAMQVNLALVGVAQNEVVKRLAGWGAILAIPTVVFSLYGMNFKFMPELNWPLGYPVTIGLTIAACAAAYWRLRRTGWV